MSISFLPYVHDDVRDLWVIPALARDDGDAFEMSVSNGNAVGLLLALGLSPEPDGITVIAQSSATNLGSAISLLTTATTPSRSQTG